MRLGIVVGNVRGSQAEQTTTHLALAAHNRGHEVWFVSCGDLSFDSHGRVWGRARGVSQPSYPGAAEFRAELVSDGARRERIPIDELDVLLLRFNPAPSKGPRPWELSASLMFAQAVTRSGTLVLNDPLGLCRSLNKLYFHMFPPEVVPRSLVTRSAKEIRDFVKEFGTTVIKPLSGSGGRNVFVIRPPKEDNLNQIVEAVARDGFVVAQEYLKAAHKGDTRMFLMNGVPLIVDGKVAAVQRLKPKDDIRSNVHIGGTPARAEVGETELRIAELVRPRLSRDGMFLVGLDIVGDKLVEINVFSPGGLQAAASFDQVDYFQPVVDALECKVRLAQVREQETTNAELAMW